MGNQNLIPYETIVRATSGEPEAVDEVLRYYSQRIRYAVIENDYVNPDTEDGIKSRLVAALLSSALMNRHITEVRFVGKIIILTFKDTEEKAVERAIAALADMLPLEAIQPPHSPAMIFPGLEIRLHQRRVLKDGADISLTRLEYGALCYLAASPGRVFTKAQIFEAVWSMESESCQSNVTNVICNLRKKIEPDSQNPTYIKTVLGIGYKFASGE